MDKKSCPNALSVALGQLISFVSNVLNFYADDYSFISASILIKASLTTL